MNIRLSGNITKYSEQPDPGQGIGRNASIASNVALSSISSMTGIDFSGMNSSGEGIASTGSPKFGEETLGTALGSVLGGPLGGLVGKSIDSALGSKGGTSVSEDKSTPAAAKTAA